MLENALREKGYTRGILRSQSRWRRWAAWWRPQYRAVFHTLRRNRGYGRWSGAVLADGTVTRIKNVPRRAAARTFVISSLATKVHCAISLKHSENLQIYAGKQSLLWLCAGDMKTGFNILREIMVEGYRP